MSFTLIENTFLLFQRHNVEDVLLSYIPFIILWNYINIEICAIKISFENETYLCSEQIDLKLHSLR